MNKVFRIAAPNVGYGLTILATLFLGNIALLLATLDNPATAAMGHLAQVTAFAIMGSLALILTGLNINRAFPLTDRSAMVWIWFLSAPVSRRLAEITLSVRWEQGMMVEAGLLGAAMVIVLMSAGRLAAERP